ncbi:MAG: membrane protein insertion efficiency factor YidD [Rhodospirillaceae bacterium]|nr:membrane protein insertion efficiency factor YidD [Rhodospirillaceae bacterium]MBT5242295.1 membrane protein insertion efficiency factor YidD [Rhodospirillaceae bacterium]MBT5566023.1 membrane protein insertion efficiency factor YidD [Rhodospirillaceae bacterium]MBT6089023.1 membrane protein insertion efficiency factor YidD [Rhodospirillaceae bacterium]MBT7449884.1 membrane protein insertion efficiency factor YidD [Rhodospirillaceae bacterium]
MTMGQRLIKVTIRGYQVLVSPLLGTRCRYHPTCSDYMAEAVTAHGALRGFYLGIKRILRCHPWAESGHDPVPCASTHSHSSLTSAKAEQ